MPSLPARQITPQSAVADCLESIADVYIVLAKLADFTAEEVNLARRLNAGDRDRAILLTERELEPHFTYERTEKLFDINATAIDLEDLAQITTAVFFENRRRADSL